MSTEQIIRIKDKLQQLRTRGWQRFKEQLGIEKHQFNFKPVATEEQVLAFERQHGIQLPEGYRQFLLEIGNGGAGPYYGIYPLNLWDDAFFFDKNPPTDFLSQPCRLSKSDGRLSKGWEKKLGFNFDDDSDDSRLWQGTITLATQGCTYFVLLVVSGELKGRLIYMDADRQPPMIVPDAFLDWYERWLDETGANLEIHWFGVGAGGSDAKLLAELQSTEAVVRSDAASGLGRRKTPSIEITQALVKATDDTDSMVKRCALSALRYSGTAGIEPALKLLQNSDTEVIKSAAWLLGELAAPGIVGTVKKWLLGSDDNDKITLALRQALAQAKNDDTFFGVGCALQKLQTLRAVDCLPFIEHPSDRLRSHAVWFLGGTKDPIALEPLLKKMEDPNTMVRVNAIQALSKNFTDKRIRPAFTAKLKVEQDPLVVSNLKNSLEYWVK